MTPVHVHQDKNTEIQTSKRKTTHCEDLKGQIDLENNGILSPRVCAPLIEFFNAIKEDFTILIDHLLLYISKHRAILINITFSALYYRKQTLVNENKINTEVKKFNVYKMVINIFHNFFYLFINGR